MAKLRPLRTVSKLNEKIKEPQSIPLKKSKAYATYKHNINKMSKTDLEQLDEEIVVDMNADYSDEFWDKAHTQEASGKMGEICEGRHSPKGKHPNHKRINIARLWLKHRDELAFVSLLDKFLDFGALECFFEL